MHPRPPDPRHPHRLPRGSRQRPLRPGAEDTCQGESACATLRDGVGICLRPCRTEGDPRACDPGSTCGRDAEGELFCRPCDCRDAPAEPVCADGRPLPNACVARCLGAETIEPGPCEPGEEPNCERCPPDAPLVCAEDRRLHLGRCDLLCERARPTELAACYREEPPALRCATDEDCFVTGCEARVCASARSRACPELSERAECVVRTGACGCIEGRCGFRPTLDTRSGGVY